MTAVLAPFVLAITGTSLTTGYLAADWVPKLQNELRGCPEAKGPVHIYNLGHGGWTSVDILANAPLLAALNPSHILFESGSINSSVDTGSGPAVTRAANITNIQAMVALWKAANPAVDLTIQSMSSISAVDTIRPNLADYYADDIATGTTLGIRTLDHYNGVPGGVAGGWPKPLAQNLTHVDPTTGLGDGLHPIWTGAVDTYLYPNVLAWARARMAELWPA
jgi:hypothetical protein